MCAYYPLKRELLMTAPEKTTWPIICKIHPQGQLIKEKKSQAAPEGELYRRNEALTEQRVRFCLNLDKICTQKD